MCVVNISVQALGLLVDSIYVVYFVVEGRILHFPVIPISEKDIVDTNGAGDAFVGGKYTCVYVVSLMTEFFFFKSESVDVILAVIVTVFCLTGGRLAFYRLYHTIRQEVRNN